jgi:hypothetical protein
MYLDLVDYENEEKPYVFFGMVHAVARAKVKQTIEFISTLHAGGKRTREQTTHVQRTCEAGKIRKT